MTIKTGVYLITDMDGMILATVVDWSLAVAQTLAKGLQDKLEEPTIVRHLMVDRIPALGENVKDLP